MKNTEKNHGGKRKGAGSPAAPWKQEKIPLSRPEIPKFLAKPVRQILIKLWPQIIKIWNQILKTGHLNEDDLKQILKDFEKEMQVNFFKPQSDNPETGLSCYDEAVYASHDEIGTTAFIHQASIVDLNTYVEGKNKVKGEMILIPVTGDSMIDAGIEEGDLLAVESVRGTYIEPRNRDIVIAQVDGAPTVKRFYKNDRSGTIQLVPENHINSEHLPKVITEDMDFQLVGIVRLVLHDV